MTFSQTVRTVEITQLKTLQKLFFPCLHGVSLYLGSLAPRKVLKGTLCRSAVPSICGFISLCSAHQIPAASASNTPAPVSSTQQNHALLGLPPCASAQSMSPGCSFISFVSCLSLQGHSAVLKILISYMLPSVIVGYDVREACYHQSFQRG